MNRNSQRASALKMKLSKDKTGRNVTYFNNQQVSDKTFYLNANLSGTAGIKQLVDVNTKRIVGITNLDGNKFLTGRDVVLDGIRITEAAAGATNLESADFTGQLIPNAQILTGELTLVQDGNILIDLPISDIVNKSNGVVEYRHLSHTPLVRADKEFEFYITYPNGVTAPADSFVKFEFRAFQFKR